MYYGLRPWSGVYPYSPHLTASSPEYGRTCFFIPDGVKCSGRRKLVNSKSDKASVHRSQVKKQKSKLIPDNQISRLLVSLSFELHSSVLSWPGLSPFTSPRKKDWKISSTRNVTKVEATGTFARLAPHYLDSLVYRPRASASGVRPHFEFSIFLQLICPDPWLELLNLWEVSYENQFCGKGSNVRQWHWLKCLVWRSGGPGYRIRREDSGIRSSRYEQSTSVGEFIRGGSRFTGFHRKLWKQWYTP